MIRRLDPIQDVGLYRQCWRWQSTYPRWLKDALNVYAVTTFAEFMELARGARADIGVFAAERLLAVFSLQWKAVGVYEVHFSARRGTNIVQLIEPCLSIQYTVFNELPGRFLFAFTPRHNRAAIVLATAIGLQADGVQRLAGASRGRVITWQRLSMSKEDYAKSIIQTNTNAVGDDSAFANRIADINVNAGGEYSRHRAA